MQTKIILFILCVVLLTSCYEEGKVIVENKVSNVRLESVNWADYSITYSLLPGEKSEKVVIREYRDAFPITGQLEFYMVGNGNQVYLKTKESYILDYNELLQITISDSTQVINPMIK
jgi:hypothetical protein